MARQQATPLQVSGYRFLVRRLEHALVRGDARMVDDPLRAQSLSLVVGCVLSAVALAGCVVLALLRPDSTRGSAPIVMVRDSGALYVRVDDVLHPVLNLASARLVVGTAADPHLISASAVAHTRRGPLVGIPGAPALISPALHRDESGWTVCDADGSTTVIAGRPVPSGHPIDTAGQVLVTPREGGAAVTYLLYDGWRARVDLRDGSVVRALRLEEIVPQPVSQVLLDAIPEAAAISAPHIPNAGSPGPASLGGRTIGSVVRITRTDVVEYYVVLGGGVQRIGEVAADLIRFSFAQPYREIPTLAADAIAGVVPVTPLPVAAFPARAGVVDAGVVCAQWVPDAGDNRSHTTVAVGASVPVKDEAVVALAQADGEGPHIDAVRVPQGRSAFVRSTGITGSGASGGSLFLIDDLGVVFGVHDEQTAEHLGLSGPPVPAPWPLLARLPRGPELSRDSASVVRDTVAPS